MLQYRSVYPTTLELLKEFSANSLLNDFFLVGGTALALHLGHRISVDLDFFTLGAFEAEPILEEIRKTKKIQVLLQKENNSIILNVEHPENSGQFVKVDCLRYAYPLIKKVQQIDGIRLLAVEDIIPMKLSAVTNRGAKKDFFDLYELLKRYSLKEMLKLFSIKFPDIDHFHVIKSLTYFEDADDDFDPISLNDTDWDQVKQTMYSTVNSYL